MNAMENITWGDVIAGICVCETRGREGLSEEAKTRVVTMGKCAGKRKNRSRIQKGE